MTTLILLNGSNVANIADEATALLMANGSLEGGAITKTLLVVGSRGKLTIPSGLKGTYIAINCDDFVVNIDERYILIANGGSREQLLTVLQAFKNAKVEVEVYDIQRYQHTLYAL
jgi:hypothetical protein